VLTCFAPLLPSLAALAVPMSFMVAAMVAVGQLTDSGEIMALRASGFSYREITRPLLWAAIALSMLMLVVNHKVGPDGYHSFRKRTTEAAQKVARVELRPRSFIELGPWRLYARGSDSKTGALEGVYLVKPGATQGMRINAEKGTLTTDPGRGITLELVDGQLQLPSKEPQRFTSGRFERYSVFVPLSSPLAAPRSLDIQEMTTPVLLRKASLPETTVQHRLEYRVEASVRTVAALAPFVFFWVGVPLGMVKRRTRGADFAASVGVLFVFYGLLVVGVSLGRKHESLSFLAPWICNAAGFVAGVVLTRKAAAL
jgi:lipopolysaccharide export LptBFGC system permease protein LptF